MRNPQNPPCTTKFSALENVQVDFYSLGPSQGREDFVSLFTAQGLATSCGGKAIWQKGDFSASLKIHKVLLAKSAWTFVAKRDFPDGRQQLSIPFRIRLRTTG